MAPLPRRSYTHQLCPVCRDERDFKFLPYERDEYERTLMVCTRCNTKIPKPGQTKVDWRADLQSP
jgi:CRISPR/Cas system-associated protein Cas10 (large subunit of type III CRISPR-Cas system)